MKLKIIPATKNTDPIKGLLIKGQHPLFWISEIQRMFAQMSQIKVYPIPDTTPNSVWGCFVEFYTNQLPKEVGQHTLCQLAHEAVFIPVFTKMIPNISPQEKSLLFRESKYVFHPEFGWYELSEEINWTKLLDIPAESSTKITIPEKSKKVPNRIKSFQIIERQPEDILINLDATTPEDIPSDKLSPSEKLKYKFLKSILRNGKGIIPDALKNSAYYQKLNKELEELEKRNQKKLDKLLDLIKKNPENALRYAIPLDQDGASRNPSSPGLFKLTRNTDFSLFQKFNNGGGGASVGTEQFDKLRERYNQAARQLIKKEEYLKASYIYLNLLNDKRLAATTLISGKLYAEAAAVYLDRLDDKKNAAKYFHKAHMTKKAIELYNEIKSYEIAGDLSQEIGLFSQAENFYNKEVKKLKDKNRPVAAAVILNKKLNNPNAAREVLLTGWEKKQNSKECLLYYIALSDGSEQKLDAIQTINQTIKNHSDAKLFLEVIKKIHKKNDGIQDGIVEIAYQNIVKYHKDNKNIIHLLKSFIPDKRIQNDILAFLYYR